MPISFHLSFYFMVHDFSGINIFHLGSRDMSVHTVREFCFHFP